MLDEIDLPKPRDPWWRSRTAHRNLPPDVAAMLRAARSLQGWTKSEASRRTTVSRRMITLLERGERYPSMVLAEALIAGYRIPHGHASRLREVALPSVGRSSPFRLGTMGTDDEPGLGGDAFCASGTQGTFAGPGHGRPALTSANTAPTGAAPAKRHNRAVQGENESLRPVEAVSTRAQDGGDND